MTGANRPTLAACTHSKREATPTDNHTLGSLQSDAGRDGVTTEKNPRARNSRVTRRQKEGEGEGEGGREGGRALTEFLVWEGLVSDSAAELEEVSAGLKMAVQGVCGWQGILQDHLQVPIHHSIQRGRAAVCDTQRLVGLH